MMPEDGLETLSSFDAIYLGVVGWPTVPDHVTLWGLLLPIRRALDQYVNLRPARLLRGVTSPLAEPNDLDITVVRENTEGTYPSLFEPIHSSAPDIAGEGVANPAGAIWAGAMMLDHVGYPDAGARGLAALEETLASGTKTRDLGGTATTNEMTDAVVKRLGNQL